jgi:hypothetical protein
MLEDKSLVAGSTKVPKRTVKRAAVLVARVCRVSPKGSNGVCQVWTRAQYGVHQGAHSALVGLCVVLWHGEFCQVLVGKCWCDHRARVDFPKSL